MAHTLLSVVTFDRSVYQESCLGPRDLHSFPTRRSSDLGMDHAGAVLGPVFAWWLLASGSSHQDRKSTRLNSSHRCISYAVFCLKKKTIPYAGSAAACPHTAETTRAPARNY